MRSKGKISRAFSGFKYHKVIMLFLLALICVLCLVYTYIPRKYVISPVVSQILFGYSEEDEIDISEQISYSLGNQVSEKAYYDISGNVVFYANRTELKELKHKLKIRYDTFDYSDFVTMSSDCDTITIKDSDDLRLCIVKSYMVFQYCILDQLLNNINPNDVNIRVIIIEESSDKKVCDISWPKQDPLIAFNDYQDLIDNTD